MGLVQQTPIVDPIASAKAVFVQPKLPFTREPTVSPMEPMGLTARNTLAQEGLVTVRTGSVLTLLKLLSKSPVT